MWCPKCIGTAILVVVVLLIIWMGVRWNYRRRHFVAPSGFTAGADSGAPRTEFVKEIPVPMGTYIRPPIATVYPENRGPARDLARSELDGPDDPAKKPAQGYPESSTDLHRGPQYVKLPRGGMSCPNKRWYDSIYNGGVATAIVAPGIEKSDMDLLWHHDYREAGYNGILNSGDFRGPDKFEEPPTFRNMFV